MSTSYKWVLASRNPGKVREFQAWAKPWGIDLIAAPDLALPEVDEPYATFLENALHKARVISKLTGLPTLADDSGLCVPALGGKPGVYSARFAGEPSDDARNNRALLEAMRGLEDRRAYYYAILVMCEHADDPQPCIAQGEWWGRIAEAPNGKGGFGYDPIFFDEAAGLTAAQLPSAAKRARSHRGKALNDLERLLVARYGISQVPVVSSLLVEAG